MSAGTLSEPFILYTTGDWHEDIEFYVETTSTADNLSGYSAVLVLTSEGRVRHQFTFSSVDGFLVWNSASSLGIRLSQEDKESIPVGNYKFSLHLVDADGFNDTVLTGSAEVVVQ